MRTNSVANIDPFLIISILSDVVKSIAVLKKSRLDKMAYIANVSYEFKKTDVMGFKMPFKTFDGIDYKFWTFMPDNIEEHLAGLREADIRDDDVIICTYPRSGTNWTNEIVGMLLNNSANYVDSILDYMDMIPKQKLAEKPSPRLYISHFPLKYLPEQLAEKGRIICVFRNPKDLAVSFYNLLIKVNFADFTGSFGDFLKLFLNGDLPGGTWFGHVKEWEKDIEVNNAKSILPIYYEDMKQDLRGHVETIAQFLGLPKNNELYDNITRKCTFKNLNAEKKKNVPEVVQNFSKDKSNYLYWKGEVGGWKNWFTVAQNEEFNSIYQSEMKDSKLKLKFML